MVGQALVSTKRCPPAVLYAALLHARSGSSKFGRVALVLITMLGSASLCTCYVSPSLIAYRFELCLTSPYTPEIIKPVTCMSLPPRLSLQYPIVGMVSDCPESRVDVRLDDSYQRADLQPLAEELHSSRRRLPRTRVSLSSHEQNVQQCPIHSFIMVGWITS